MPSVVFDNFTAADGTALENHTPNTGSGAWDVSVRTDWGDVIGPATDNMLIAGNQLVQAQPANTHIRALIDAGSANSTVEVDVTPPEGVFAMALLGQASTTTAGGWILHIGYVSFLRDSAGNNTYFSHSYTAGETYGLSMTFDNGAVTARINGEVVATMTGSNGPDTYAGLASHVDSVYSAAAFDNFTVTTSATVVNSVMVVYSGDGFQGTQDGQFLLYRDDPTGALTVNYVLAQCANQVDANPTYTSGQATFANGDSYTVVNIPSSAVSSNGADEIFTLKILADEGSDYHTANLSESSLTIHAQARVWIDSVQYAVEGESAGYFRLERASTYGEMTVFYVLDSGPESAVEGLDFAPLPGFVAFLDGQQYADVVIDPTGQYANANMTGDKTVVIQLTGLDATAMPADRGPVVILAPAVPPPAAPTFPAANYTFYAGEGMHGVNQANDTPWSWIDKVEATDVVSYAITAGNDAGYFQINNGGYKGWITPARDLPLENSTYNLTVTATNRGGSTNIPVTIQLVPWVYITGDLQGVKDDIGGGRRDRIHLDFVRIASAAELQNPLTVALEVTWLTTSRDDLVNPEELPATLTFAAGRGVSSKVLTPTQLRLDRPMSTFRVRLADNNTPAYRPTFDFDRLNLERDWAQRSVTCTIFPSTTLFGSDNASLALADADRVHFNDILQGKIGDCYLLADLAAMAATRPADIRNMFADLGDGRYRVTFYNFGNLQAEFVDVDMELTFGISQANFLGDYSQTPVGPSYEIWPQILEKAYSQWFGRRRFVNGTVGVDIGGTWHGSTWTTMTRLTGQVTTETDMESLGAAARDAYLNGIVQDLAANKPVTVIETAIVHAWAVTGYDANTDEFILYNPWGNSLRLARANLIARFRWAIRLS